MRDQDWAQEALSLLIARLGPVGGVVDLVAPQGANGSTVFNIEAPHSFAQISVWANGQIDTIVLDADSNDEVINLSQSDASPGELQERMDALLVLLLDRATIGARVPQQ